MTDPQKWIPSCGKFLDFDLDIIKLLLGDVAGDIAEVGVYQGALFHRLCYWAKARGCKAHAFDSFEGMGNPGELDGGHYPSGGYICHTEDFAARMTAKNADPGVYRLHKGFIPGCFSDGDPEFALIYIDVDQYQPTKDAIEWAVDHLAPGGLLGFDDFIPNREILAARAIDEFRRNTDMKVVFHNINHQIFFRSHESK